MKKYVGNHSFLKELNMVTALGLIQEKNLISRASLAQMLGLNRSTITVIINELLEQGLVKEVGIGASKGGRPPTLLQFNSDAAYTVSIDWSLEHVRIFVTNLGGEIYFSEQLLLNPDHHYSTHIKKVINIVSSTIEQLPDKPLGLLGIGIIVPGIVDKGVVNSYALQWASVPLQSYFTDQFDCTIVINNDANAGLIAEYYFGCAKGERDVFYIRLGRSLSAGFIFNGLIYQGSEGFAGRLGHNTIVANGRKCSCGNKGCWEAYISEHALIQRYLETAPAGHAAGDVTLAHIVQAANDSDPHAISAIHELSEYLGMGVANIVNLLNPKMVIINNKLGPIEHLLSPSFQTIFERKALPYLGKNVKVLFSNLGEQSITLGATALVLNTILTTPHIASARLNH